MSSDLSSTTSDTISALSSVPLRPFSLLSDLLLPLPPLLRHLPTAGVAAGSDLHRSLSDAKTLAADSSTKSNLYLLLNSRRTAAALRSASQNISQSLPALIPHLPPHLHPQTLALASSLASAQFALNAAHEIILSRVESAVQNRSSDRSYANSLLSLIADALGIPTDHRAALKKEFDQFRREVEEAKMRKNVAEAIQMELIVKLLGRADAALSFKEKELKYFSRRNSLGSQPLEPLQSFYCPITRDVMEDPVETSSGQTFERSAIEKWLADGNCNCPLTMTPLDAGFLRPNVTLRKSIEEWKERNTMITIGSIKGSLGSGSEEEVLKSLGELQELCEVKDSNRECVVMENYLPVLVGLLARSGSPIRNRALLLLCLLAKDSDDNKVFLCADFYNLMLNSVN